jgi:hypothetical protein
MYHSNTNASLSIISLPLGGGEIMEYLEAMRALAFVLTEGHDYDSLSTDVDSLGITKTEEEDTFSSNDSNSLMGTNDYSYDYSYDYEY